MRFDFEIAYIRRLSGIFCPLTTWRIMIEVALGTRNLLTSDNARCNANNHNSFLSRVVKSRQVSRAKVKSHTRCFGLHDLNTSPAL